MSANAATKAKVRTRRSPADKAQDVLDFANARYARAEKTRNRLRDELAAAEKELEAADRHARHAAAHPDLPTQDVELPFTHDDTFQPVDG